VYRKICGEANSVNVEEVVGWKDTILLHLMAKYAPKDIFSADECGLFYNMLPDKMYTFKGASCKGIKVSYERITVLVCVNLAGTEKLPLFVIRKPNSHDVLGAQISAMHLPSQQDCLDDM
jgi:hypothetical protein